MIYVFIPYYNEDTPEFTKSLKSQTVTSRIIKRNRKRDKIYWTKAVRDFQREIKRFCGAKDDDVVCVMNNDIQFEPDLFEEGSEVSVGECYVPKGNQVQIDWKHKGFHEGLRVDGFYGRCFFMTLYDFKRIKFSRLLPHYLADLDFGIRVVKRLSTYLIDCQIIHDDHSRKEGKFILNTKNPIFWTIFLLKHPNKYTFINILKSWYEIFR